MNKINTKKIFLTALCFLLVRNIFFCFLLPLWSHGDEIAHFDYVLKLNRGHFPEPVEYIETSLFALHKMRWDNRIITHHKAHGIRNIEDLGLAGHSYEANQPPLPYLIMALVRKGLLFLNVPLLLQVKLLRVFTLFPLILGLVIIYKGLQSAKIKHPVYYYPLFFIPLLPQDMFFSINTDCYSFFFASLAVVGIIRLFLNSSSWKAWILLSAGVILCLWTKATNALLFVLWPVLIIFFWVEQRNRKKILIALLVLLIILVFSSPWYIYNQMRFSDPFRNTVELDYPEVLPRPVSFSTLKIFALGFNRTLFRGEFLWNGRYIEVFSALGNTIVLVIMPLLIFAAGFVSFFFYFDRSKKHLKYLILCGAGTISALLLAYFAVGGLPYYQVRYGFAGLYFMMLVYAIGWKKIIPQEPYNFYIPAAWLLSYNLVYAYNLFTKVTL
ncbi:MAG: hypothetical protein GF421_03255 [Candidatus Aminicenantes bacterium]|nr:hypothetical protein [Candidatus Aminicenantes bacterium]